VVGVRLLILAAFEVRFLLAMLKKHGKTYFSNRFLWNIIGFELTLAIQNVRKTGVEPARTRAVPK